jgi:replicative DNA helicase
VEEALRALAAWPLFFEDSPVSNIDQIVPLVQRHHARHPLALVIVDYLTLLEGKGQTRTQEIGSVSRGFKRLAKDCDVPVLVLAQLNRAVESRPSPRPYLSDLRDSGEIEQDADKIAFLWRSDDGHRLSLEKNRLGPTGTIALTTDFEIGLISEAEEHR